mgnify:CR=1 FL=1
MRLNELKKAIQEFTRECRVDMHEPDEQGIRGVVRGRGFDNACCPHTHRKYKMSEINRKTNFGTYTAFDLFLELTNDKGEVLNLNLADLVNLARQPMTKESK